MSEEANLPGTVELTANSALTFTSSTAATQSKIRKVFEDLSENSPSTTALPNGRFITPIDDKRIVWTRKGDGILVLTIFSPSA